MCADHHEGDRWTTLQGLFEAAAALPRAERTAFLDRACGADAALRAELDRLLDSDADGGAFLEAAVGSAIEALRGGVVEGHAPGLTGAAPPPGPERLGRYEIAEELGRGGMGVVYRARDPERRRDVAVKVLPREEAREESRLARFRREAEILAGLDHPNIASVLGIEEADGAHLLVMELVPGLRLDRLWSSGPLPLADAISLGLQIADALEAAHRRRLVHRDLKPANVMVTPEGRIKVLDFGIARDVGESPRARQAADDLTLPGAVLASPGYSSPEQLRGQPVDPRSDIWSLGCVIFECLSGRPAFGGANAFERVAATLQRAPPWNTLPRETPAALRMILIRCLSRDVSQRPRDVAEVRRVLEWCRDHAGGLEPEEAGEGVARDEVRRDREARPGRIPAAVTRFVGRERELAATAHHLGAGRLVTLIGPGGSGKSRVAAEAGQGLVDRFAGGVWMVELAALEAPLLIASTVAAVFGLREGGEQSHGDVLVEHLRTRELLLILDNCEHLIDAAAALAGELLGQCPRLHILATSRQALGIAGEQVIRLAPLPVPPAGRPESLEALARVEAVELFVDRVKSARAEFELGERNQDAVIRICRGLDGMPLALELAAARAQSMPVDDIAAHLDDRLRLLTAQSGSALPRHQTLRALLDWSYELLSPPEKRLFRRLSIFAGGWTLKTALPVCDAEDEGGWALLDRLCGLVDKSLVEVDRTGDDGERGDGTRYRFLETVRAYAREKLSESGEVERVRDRYVGCFVDLAETAMPELIGNDQARWLGMLQAEHDNFRSALRHCLDTEFEGQPGLRMAGALGRYWNVQGHWSEGRAISEALLDLPSSARRTAARAETLNWSGMLASWQGDLDLARARHEEALSIRRELQDLRGIGASLNNLALAAQAARDYPRAVRLFQESLSVQRQRGDPWGTAVALSNLGTIHDELGELPEARALYEESIRTRRDIADRTGLGHSLTNLGLLAVAQGSHDEALALFAEAAEIQRELGDRFSLSQTLYGLGNLMRRQGRIDEARGYYGECINVCRDIGDRPGIAQVLEASGAIAHADGDDENGARLLAAAERLREEIHSPLAPADRAEVQAITGVVRSSFGAGRAERAWARGRALSGAEAIDTALRVLASSGRLP